MKTILTFIFSILLSSSMTLAQDIKIGSSFIMTGGTIMYVDGDVDIDHDGDLKLESGSTLILGEGKTLSVNDGGKLTLMGEDGNPVTVTSAGYFVFVVSSGGTIGGEYATFEKMSGNGLNIQPGAMVDPSWPLNNSVFQNGTAGSTFLTINNNQTLTIDGVAFIATPGHELYNVSKTLNIGEVTFTNFSGNFAGEAYENDPFNRIHWGDEPLNNLVENVTVTDGEEYCFDALQTVIVQDLVVESGGHINLVAGQSVLLLPGVLIQANGYLRAWIDPDGFFCDIEKAVVAAPPVDISPDYVFEDSLLDELAIKVYPNPTRGIFTVELSGSIENATTEIKVYGLMGQMVEQITLFNENRHEFNLGDSPPGIYMVRVLQGDRLYVEKLIKQ